MNAAASIATDDEVLGALKAYEIQEVLHFTTNIGLAGILGDGVVLSRQRLPKEKHLASVYPPNASRRYDVAWLDYVNCSITRINLRYYDASERWHAAEDRWWCVLSFDSVVAAHKGVFFATTNNRYSSCQQKAGVEGLRDLWAEEIEQWPGSIVRRGVSHQKQWPTCRQAEVLYPKALSTDYLRCVYVVNESHADIASVSMELLRHRPVPVEVRRDVFK